jgi:hypothetical protein
MNDRTEPCRPQDGNTANNNLSGVGSEHRKNDTRREPDALPRHRERSDMETHNDRVPAENSTTKRLAENSGEDVRNLNIVDTVVKNEPADLARIPENVRASVEFKPGEYDARRLRSQREIIRDVMISAADCETWLTLGELRALTRYGEASISAQLRHLRKTENGGYEVIKRHRDGASPTRPGTDGHGEFWNARRCGLNCEVEWQAASSWDLRLPQIIQKTDSLKAVLLEVTHAETRD